MPQHRHATIFVLAISVLWLFSCVTIAPHTNDPVCDPRTLSSTEVRIRTLFCGDEYILGGATARGDILMENSRLRLGFRNIGTSLSTWEGNGGSLVDITLVDVEDAWWELLPYADDKVLSVVDMHMQTLETHAEITIQTEIDTRYISLYPDAKIVHFDQTTDPLVATTADWLIRPKPESTLYGKQLFSHHLQYTLDAEIEDMGGDIVLRGLQKIRVQENTPSIPDTDWSDWGDTQTITLHSDGEYVDLYENGVFFARIRTPISPTILHIPKEINQMEIGAEGCVGTRIDVDSTITNMNITGSVGACGSLKIRVHDENAEIDAVLHTEFGDIYIPQDGLVLPYAHNIEHAWISAGIEYDIEELPPIDVFAHPTLELFLHKKIDIPTQMHILFHQAPSRTSRDMHTAIWNSIGEQSDWIVYLSDDIVPPTTIYSPHTQIIFGVGNRSENPEYSIYSWPWVNNNKTAFGALHSAALSTEQMLHQTSASQRVNCVDIDTWNAIDRANIWQLPDFVCVEDMTTAGELCSLREQSRMLGTHTWIHETPSTQEEVLHALLTGNYHTGKNAFIQVEYMENTLLSSIVTREATQIFLLQRNTQHSWEEITTENLFTTHNMSSLEIANHLDSGRYCIVAQGSTSWAIDTITIP